MQASRIDCVEIEETKKVMMETVNSAEVWRIKMVKLQFTSEKHMNLTNVDHVPIEKSCTCKFVM